MVVEYWTGPCEGIEVTVGAGDGSVVIVGIFLGSV